MTLRESAIAILTALQEHPLMIDGGISVDFGKFGEMPSLVPCVWVYLEPEPGTPSQDGNAVRKSKFTLFACHGGETNPVFSALNAIELCEKLEKILGEIADVIIEPTGEPPKFDGYYSDFAAAYIEFNVVYDSTQE